MGITLNHIKTDSMVIQNVEHLDVSSEKIFTGDGKGFFWSTKIKIKTDDGETTIKIFTDKKLDLSESSS